MSNNQDLKDGVIAVSELLECFPRFGIPNFQRGLVWGNDAVSLLLESLYFDTPCGTVILWKPQDPQAHGVALTGNEPFDYLIIDGQQRIRSLYAALHEGSSEDDDAEDDPEGPRIWCLNLAKLPGLRGLTEEQSAAYPLFRHVLPPTHEKARFQHDHVPLSALLAGTELDVDPEQLRWRPSSPRLPERLRELRVRETARSMLQRSLFLLVKQESDSENRLPQMVDLYNRINTGGKRVEAEERAFAALTAIWPGTGDWLRELFREVHGEEADGQRTGELSRDAVLARKKERSFGFKLFVRTFLQTASYHLGYSVGSSNFSFEIATRADFQAALGSTEDRESVATMWDHAKRAILEVRRALSELGCDDLQSLPDTDSLLPVFQLLIRYPTVLGIDRYRAVVKCLVLRLLLANKPPRELLELVKTVNDANTFRECVVELLEKLPVKALRIERELESSNSLQDRYVLLLYWLLRTRAAEDFSSAHVEERLRPNLEEQWAKEKRRLREEISPEKQHIVPYSKLRDVLSIPGRARLSTHEANNIGNLTYISRLLNHFETGLGDKAIKLRDEPAENLRRHFLLEDDRSRESSDIARHYALTIDAGKRSHFTAFCALRRRLIARAFEAWTEELERSLVLDSREEPIGPLFARSWSDVVRGFDYGDALEDCIVGWLKEGARPRGDQRFAVLAPESLRGARVRLSKDEVVIDGGSGRHLEHFHELVAAELPVVTVKGERTTYAKPMPPERKAKILQAIDEVAAVAARSPTKDTATAP